LASHSLLCSPGRGVVCKTDAMGCLPETWTLFTQTTTLGETHTHSQVEQPILKDPSLQSQSSCSTMGRIPRLSPALAPTEEVGDSTSGCDVAKRLVMAKRSYPRLYSGIASSAVPAEILAYAYTPTSTLRSQRWRTFIQVFF
jgi:hypothetical protein